MAVESAAFDVLDLLVVLGLAWVFGALSERVGYPALMGELFAGILFGPAILGLLGPSEPLAVFAEFGVFLLMVYVGMEVDIDDIVRLGPQSLLVAIGGFVLPFALGAVAGVYIGASLEASLFIGLAMAATSLATKSRILVDMDLLDTRIAGVLLGGALISDVGVMVVFAGVMAFAAAGTVDVSAISIILIEAVAFFAVTLFIGYTFLPKMWRGLEELRQKHGFVDKTAAFTVAMLVALLFAAIAHALGLHVIIGGFIAGMFLRQAEISKGLYTRLHTVVYDLAIGFFAPIFFVTVGFDLTLSVFRQDLWILVLLTGVAFIGKIIGSWLGALPSKLTSREGFVIGLGMNGRGTVEIIIASIGLSAGIITQDLFTILVFLAIFTTALVPPTMTWGIDWLERCEGVVRIAEPITVEPEPGDPVEPADEP